jgi:hypothetical protein
MFILIEDDNEAVSININNITNIHYDFKTETIIIYYIGAGNVASEFEGDNALKIYNYLKSSAAPLSFKE